uniref:Uncharacterized LOC100178363 n=1 Tax=Ciona intestinalis TaxID=7719 RepID=A0A1W3JIP1_CIOIN|nr:uncharacterized protein LOC100178363 isoform X2 [Ciona intestinalis]|eukprot:XP_002130120.1 uncharacterized protein LOC100178363 isoform X2 [Ciona intestinalis]
MARKSQKNKENEEQEKQKKIEAVVENYDTEVKAQIEAYRKSVQNVTDNLRKEMQVTLMSIPKHVQEMTLREYCEKYIIEAKSREQGESGNDHVENIEEMTTTSVATSAVKGKSKRVSRAVKGKRGRKKSSLKNPVLATPVAHSGVVQGTPIFKPGLTETCTRTMTPRDISNFQLQLFSSRGSPLHIAANHMSEEMQRKVAEQFANITQGLQRGLP